MRGADILPIARSKIGQEYVLGARAQLDNPDYNGPWDCAEYASWCVNQAYSRKMGLTSSGDPYSGSWAAEAEKSGARVVSVGEALSTPGAILVRQPKAFGRTIGHVAICVGNGNLLEARGKNHGVVESNNAASRPWSLGILVPGVAYKNFGSVDYIESQSELELQDPNMKGLHVFVLELALKDFGYKTGRIDGVFNNDTAKAVTKFQGDRGLLVDGVVGRETAQALGIDWPINESLLDIWVEGGNLKDRLDKLEPPAEENEEVPVDLRDLEEVDVDANHAFGVRLDGRHSYLTLGNSEIYVGIEVGYKNRRGLANISRSSRMGEVPGGTYDAGEAEQHIGNWAHLLRPTIMAESAGKICAVQSYDRAAFTFGCFQMAAHTAGDNLILYMRDLLKLPSKDRYFPELFLKDNKVHRRLGRGAMSLETPKRVKVASWVETQIPDFMAFWNDSPGSVDEGEILAAGRLILWNVEQEEARALQYLWARDTITKKLNYAAAKGIMVWDLPAAQAVWVADIRHQSRAKYSQIKAALSAPNPERALSELGGYEQRRRTVAKYLKALFDTRPGWRNKTLLEIVSG